MNFDNIKSALQDLIIRLQDAEKGFLQISDKTSNATLKTWTNKFGKERHEMHKALELHMKGLNGNPEVKTSILGDLHRMFIDFKFNFIDDNIESAIAEIERGTTTLINDYEQVLAKVEMPSTIVNTLIQQKSAVEAELQHLKDISKAYKSVEV